jgi:hypothetical protein
MGKHRKHGRKRSKTAPTRRSSSSSDSVSSSSSSSSSTTTSSSSSSSTSTASASPLLAGARSRGAPSPAVALMLASRGKSGGASADNPHYEDYGDDLYGNETVDAHVNVLDDHADEHRTHMHHRDNIDLDAVPSTTGPS